ncbi:MAG: cytochrome c family protein [Gemmataceae bacterium]|nr:cytochrome c family protein [Gemmataceae bacterium]
MAQIFPKAVNPVTRLLVLGLPMMFGATGVGLAAFYRSSYATGVDEIVPQPVAFSHAHHVGQLGIHCLYCHTSVEESHFANIPPTKTCMNCHQEIWTGADLLAPVRASYRADTPIVWNRVHNVPHYAYFNHSIHVAKGVGCYSCHGPVDDMNLTWQSKTLLMEWCINCHRNPQENLRPTSEVFNLRWQPGATADGSPQVWVRADLPNYGKNPDGTDTTEAAELLGKPRPDNQPELGKVLKELYHVRDAVTLIGCSNCHR